VADTDSDWKNTDYHLQAANQEVPAGDDMDSLAYQLQAAEEELDMAHEDLGKELDRKAELANQRRALQKKQTQSPAFKKMMREIVESRIAEFVEAFDISPEDAKAFADIQLEKAMAFQELYLEAEEITNPTEADKARFGRLQQDQQTEYEAKAEALLGDAVYREYDPYERRWYIEEYDIGGFSSSLDPDVALTDSQEEALVDALFEAQETAIQDNTAQTEEMQSTFVFPSEQYTPEQLDKTVEYMTSRNETILEKAGEILSAAQMEQLRTYLAQNLAQTIDYAKMTALEHGYSYDIDDEVDISN
jgi:hypothetical protein